MRELLGAFTPAENNPPYISINLERSPTVSCVEIIVRTQGIEEQLGSTAVIRMSEKDFAQLWNETKCRFQAIQLMDADGE